MSKKTKQPEPEFTQGQKVWVTGRALSIGIQSGVVIGNYQGWFGLFSVRLDGAKNPKIFYTRQLHSTEESTKLSAELMRDRRIKSLRKQIETLEKVKF